MICKRCNNQMVWVGSMHGGKLSCEHCANDDSLTEAIYRDTHGYAAGVANVGGLAHPIDCEVCGGAGDSTTHLYIRPYPYGEAIVLRRAKLQQTPATPCDGADDGRYLEPDYDI